MTPPFLNSNYSQRQNEQMFVLYLFATFFYCFLYIYHFITTIVIPSIYSFSFIKNASSSTSHKKTPSLRPSDCLYEILRKFFLTYSFIYMNTNVMNTQIFDFDKYNLKGHWRSQKVICLFCTRIYEPTLPLMISPHYVSSSQTVSL